MPDKLDKTVIAASAISGTAATTAGVMTGLGFTTTGIAASSTAAGMQAGVGNIVAGSFFSLAQSLGATGVYATMGLAGGIGLTIGGIYGVYKLAKHLQKPKL
jgi:hypothetical protein